MSDPQKPLYGIGPVYAALSVACSSCAGKGMIKQWIEGKPNTAHMGRCEQCSGFGKVRG